MIYLYGNLAKVFGKEHDINVSSIKEAMLALEANFPGFKNHIQKDRKYILRRGDEFKKSNDISEEELTMLFTETDFHILPLPMGYSGVAKVILGVVLIVISIYMPPAWAAFAGVVGSMGGGLVASGVSEMLTPMPSIGDYSDRDRPDERASYLFDGPTNKVAAGGAIPLIFGFDVWVGSTFLSGGLDVGDLV